MQQENDVNGETTKVTPIPTGNGQKVVKIQRGTKQVVRKNHTVPSWMLSEE